MVYFRVAGIFCSWAPHTGVTGGVWLGKGMDISFFLAAAFFAASVSRDFFYLPSPGTFSYARCGLGFVGPFLVVVFLLGFVVRFGVFLGGFRGMVLE